MNNIAIVTDYIDYFMLLKFSFHLKLVIVVTIVIFKMAKKVKSTKNILLEYSK